MRQLADELAVQCGIDGIQVQLGAWHRARFTCVMSNLIKNASEAMPGGGILTLTTDLVQNDVVIRLSDTGTGMSAELLGEGIRALRDSWKITWHRPPHGDCKIVG